MGRPPWRLVAARQRTSLCSSLPCVHGLALQRARSRPPQNTVSVQIRDSVIRVAQLLQGPHSRSQMQPGYSLRRHTWRTKYIATSVRIRMCTEIAIFQVLSKRFCAHFRGRVTQSCNFGAVISRPIPAKSRLLSTLHPSQCQILAGLHGNQRTSATFFDSLSHPSAA